MIIAFKVIPFPINVDGRRDSAIGHSLHPHIVRLSRGPIAVCPRSMLDPGPSLPR